MCVEEVFLRCPNWQHKRKTETKVRRGRNWTRTDNKVMANPLFNENPLNRFTSDDHTILPFAFESSMSSSGILYSVPLFASYVWTLAILGTRPGNLRDDWLQRNDYHIWETFICVSILHCESNARSINFVGRGCVKLPLAWDSKGFRKMSRRVSFWEKNSREESLKYRIIHRYTQWV